MRLIWQPTPRLRVEARVTGLRLQAGRHGVDVPWPVVAGAAVVVWVGWRR